MWSPSGNGLVESGIPKNPYFDPSHVFSVAPFCLISEGGGGVFNAPPATELFFIPTDTGLVFWLELID